MKVLDILEIEERYIPKKLISILISVVIVIICITQIPSAFSKIMGLNGINITFQKGLAYSLWVFFILILVLISIYLIGIFLGKFKEENEIKMKKNKKRMGKNKQIISRKGMYTSNKDKEILESIDKSIHNILIHLENIDFKNPTIRYKEVQRQLENYENDILDTIPEIDKINKKISNEITDVSKIMRDTANVLLSIDGGISAGKVRNGVEKSITELKNIRKNIMLIMKKDRK